MPTLAPIGPDARSSGITPLTLIAALIVVLHLAAASAFGPGRLSKAMETAVAGEGGCAVAAAHDERPVPYD